MEGKSRYRLAGNWLRADNNRSIGMNRHRTHDTNEKLSHSFWQSLSSARPKNAWINDDKWNGWAVLHWARAARQSLHNAVVGAQRSNFIARSEFVQHHRTTSIHKYLLVRMQKESICVAFSIACVEEKRIAGTHTLSRAHTAFDGAIRWKENERITLTHIRIRPKNIAKYTHSSSKPWRSLSLSLVCVSHRYVACCRKMRVRANTFAFNSAERWCYYVLPLLLPLLLHSFCSTIRFIVNSGDRVLCVCVC